MHGQVPAERLVPALEYDDHADAHAVDVAVQHAGGVIETHHAAQLDVFTDLGNQGLTGFGDGGVSTVVQGLRA